MSSKYDDDREQKRRALKDGEWACVDSKCAKVNDESLFVCDDCGKPKPRAKSKIGKELGKEQAEKSKGLFAAEDWVCSKCGNVNWARRRTCNVCNAPKLADLERRTGYGGGYNDRQNVEYVKRDYDEEFDEFGRKKKKKGEDQFRDMEEGEASDDEEIAEKDDLKKRTPRGEDEAADEDDEADEDDDEDEEDGEDLGKYNFDFDSDPELVEKVENLKSKIVAVAAAGSEACDDSECSCSCSGGECSCPESEDEKEKDRRKMHKSSRERDRESHRKRSNSPRDRDRKRGKRSRSRSRERSYRDDRRDRKRYRSRERRRSPPRGTTSDRRRDDERRREKERRRSRSRDRFRR